MTIKFKLPFLINIVVQGQTLKRIDGSTISDDSLTNHVQCLMQMANV